MSTPYHWEQVNDEIRGCAHTLRFYSEILQEDNAGLIDREPLEQMKVCVHKLNQCYTSMPEITERDEFMDTVQDKQYAQRELAEYANSLEQRIRVDILLKEMEILEKKLREAIWANEFLSDVYEERRIAECEAAEYAYYYGDDY